MKKEQNRLTLLTTTTWAAPLPLQVFILGGYDGEDIFGDLWRLDLDQFQWRRIPVQASTGTVVGL